MDKRIITNAAALYIRLAVSTVVGIFTSRIILDALGFADYGIYNLVGGVVVMANFLNASMSGATTRFITFELGNGTLQTQRETFTVALFAHVLIACTVLFLAETVGLWFVNTQLDIPDNRMKAVQWVYQSSVICMIVSILQVPYNATIIAHEKMNIYAYIEILNSIFKLGIAYLIYTISSDKLIIYAILVLVASSFIALLYCLYCKRQFQDANACNYINRQKLRQILSFSGYDLYGNACVIVSNQFVGVVINQFFGVLLNAANGIANTINGIVSTFTGSIIQAFRPQITKQYACGNISEMSNLLNYSLMFSILMMSCVSVPLFFEMDYVMSIWLKSVPEHASVFCKILLICNLFRVINNIISISIHATGRIKAISFGSGTIYLLQIPIMYVLLYICINPTIPYIVLAVNMMLILCLNIVILKNNIPQVNIHSIVYLLFRTFVVVGIAIIPCFFVYNYFDSCLLRVIMVTISYIGPSVLLTLYLLLGREQRRRCFRMARNKLSGLCVK